MNRDLLSLLALASVLGGDRPQRTSHDHLGSMVFEGSMEDLMRLLSDEGKDVTEDDMTKGQDILNRAMAMPAMEGFDGLLEEMQVWHDSDIVRNNRKIHAYVDNIAEGLPIIAIAKFGTSTVTAWVEAVKGNPKYNPQ